MQGLGGAGECGGRSQGEESRKASPCFPKKGGLYVIRMYRRIHICDYYHFIIGINRYRKNTIGKIQS